MQEEILAEVIKLVIREQKGNTLFLQRQFQIGYARASYLINFLEEAGILDKADGAKPRKLLVKLTK